MKKSKMMRIASVLLVAVLLSTCAISGTFAKYTTSTSAEDTARVAKWGITLTVTDNATGSDNDGNTLFAEEYDTGANRKTVVSSETAVDVVAPGTKNDKGVTFKIEGTPEVATKVTAKLDVASDVFLNYKNANDADAVYNPVVFTLKHTFGAGAYSIAPLAENVAGIESVTTTGSVDTIVGTLAGIQNVLNNLTNTMTQQDPGYIYDDEFTLTWAWDFDDNGAGTNDELDTILGNLAADPDYYGAGTYTVDVDYCLTVDYNRSCKRFYQQR